MNDLEFEERAYANPDDDSPEFRQALAESPARQQILDDIKALDDRLRAGINGVAVPDALKQTLLAIPGENRPAAGAAANEGIWRRVYPLAASILLAVALVALLNIGDENPMEAMVFEHIYSELDFMTMDAPMTLDDVNAIMDSWIDSEFEDSADMASLVVTFTKDCWVDFGAGIHGVHLIVRGEQGPLTIMVIPNEPLEEELAIADERFEGLISPLDGGNLVVVGEKNESIQQYSTMLAANINW